MMLLLFLIIMLGLALISANAKLPEKPRKNIGIVIGIIAILLLSYSGYLRRSINIGFRNILVGEMLIILSIVLLGIMVVINIVCRLLKLSAKTRKNTFIVIASIILLWVIGNGVYHYFS